jgi:competence protein ComEC
MALRIGAWLWLVTALALAVEVHVGVLAWCAAAGLAASTAVAGIGVRRPRRRVRVLVLTAVLGVVLATGVVTWRVVPLVDGPLAGLADDRAVVRADVVTTSDPQPRQGHTAGSRRTDDAWQLDAATEFVTRTGLASLDVDLPVRLLTTRDVASLLPGTRLHVTARVLPADALRGRAATLVAETLTVTAPAPLLQGAAGAVRASMRATVADRPAESAGLLPGLVVGDTSGVPPDLDTAMRDSGLSHLTAVSGGNVAIVVLLVLGAVRLAGVHRGRTQVVLVAAAVAGYVVLARPQPSVVRAAGMTAVVLVAVLADVRVRPLDALGASVGGLVLIDPFLALSVGFAMSAAATGGLLLLAARWRPQRRDADPWPRRALRATGGVLAVSAAAQVAVAPLVAGIGGGIPIGGVVANLLAEPAVPAATSFGLMAAFVGLVWAPLGSVVALPAAWAVAWIARVARVSAELAPPVPWPRGWVGALAMVGALALAGAAAYLARRHGGVVARTCLAVAAVGGVLVVAPPTSVPLGGAVWPPEGWHIVMCDVGQGDATVLNAGAGAAVVVDAGPDPKAVDRCLRRLGVTRVPVLVLSHFHADHVEGTPGVLRGRDAGPVVVSPLGEPPSEVSRVEAWLHEAGLTSRVASPGDRWTVGSVTLRVLWPARILRGQGSDPNNASVVLLGDVGGVSVLLGGDLETAGQEAVLAGGAVGPVDVVKVPHHGSSKQSSGWVAETHPRIALVGVGLGNDYGHPNAGTLASYRAAGALVGRTDLDGDLAVVLDDAHRLGLVRRGP